MSIPLLDTRQETDELWDELRTAIDRVMRSGRFILGPEVNAFEQELADYLGVKHAIGVASGTDALLIGLHALGVGPGDEVITTAFSFAATAFSIIRVGATPVFADIDPVTFNLDPRRLEAAISARTKAILPVHLFGQAADMAEVTRIAASRNLLVLEDAAQSFGGTFQGSLLGSIGDAGALSFFPSKILGAYGDGGMVVTNRDDVAETARLFRAQGARRKYENEVVGYNSRLDALQAAILRVKLPHIPEWIDRRRRIAARYSEHLNDLADIAVPRVDSRCEHAFHQYTIRVAGAERDRLRSALAERGIQTMVYYPKTLPGLPALNGHDPVPLAERSTKEVLSLPIWPQMAAEQQDSVISAIRSAVTAR